MNSFEFKNMAVILISEAENYLRNYISNFIKEYTPIYFQDDYQFLDKIDCSSEIKIILYSNKIDKNKLKETVNDEHIRCENIHDFINNKEKAIPLDLCKPRGGKGFIDNKVLNEKLSESILPEPIRKLKTKSFLFKNDNEKSQENKNDESMQNKNEEDKTPLINHFQKV
ncbi:hypothetical protein [Candidatus Uabimicrobium amorphum]|uniref:Uncharacterized protein n=1 Tax=Uabimicrobium amorphum TaxID=2596890 RepID=A0A5S9IN44_UABAM|nr:hypothetical protein [Candidatus Uabimicrobium amorphum]BBM84476.1 hypothetical protein UABAM_02837 [Candidatus Uabimicrobium amorphum]